MKLYYSPGACSLSPHIALLEAGLPYDLVKVDVRAKKLENGDDYWKVNPKGQVPALGLDNGEIMTEGPVIVQMIADQAAGKNLAPANGSAPVSIRPGGETGRRNGLKIRFSVRRVRVQVPPRAPGQINTLLAFLGFLFVPYRQNLVCV